MALSKLLTEGYGYNGPHPSKGKVSSKKILQFHFSDPETYETGGSIEVMLLPCSLFNGIGEKMTELRQCTELGCCCSEKSHVVHFKVRARTPVKDRTHLARCCIPTGADASAQARPNGFESRIDLVFDHEQPGERLHWYQNGAAVLPWRGEGCSAETHVMLILSNDPSQVLLVQWFAHLRVRV